MPEWAAEFFAPLVGAPEWVFHVVLGLAAAVENIVPPVPADVVVLLGSLLAGRAGASIWILFVAVWIGNISGALLVYLAGRRYGVEFFHGRFGRWLLRPAQMAALERIYRRYGFGVIFFSRFMPMFRAVVPVFAGVTGLGPVRTAVPLATASAIWYGAIVYAGSAAGRNVDALVAGFAAAARWLWIPAALAAVAVLAWWRRSR